MKKIINGRSYDSDKGKIADYQYGYPNDFDYLYESLHRKMNGEYFLYGDGGVKSKYATSTEPNWKGRDEKIIPLSIKEAQEWAEKHCDGDKYEEIFGTIEEDRVQISLWISETLKADADELKKNQKATYADVFAAGIAALSSKR